MNDATIMTEATLLPSERAITQEEQTENVVTEQNDDQDEFETGQEALPDRPQESEGSEEPEESNESEEPEESEDRSEFASEPDSPDYQAEISSLRSRVETLQAQLEARTAAMERMSRDCAEFSQLYPDKSLTTLPAEVWESVRDGIPLAAAYALCEVRQRRREALAAQINDRNRSSSSGGVSGTPTEILSPDEVRRMSAAQVRENYSKIIDSMKLWS